MPRSISRIAPQKPTDDSGWRPALRGRVCGKFRGFALAVTLGLSGCRSIQETPLPRPLSPPPPARGQTGVAADGLLAGFGRRDITPPPGVGMSGFSFDSRQSVGFRQRLYARAIVLEDGSGERIALVVVDLGMVSILLQRRVADRTLGSGTGIGADRLLLSATHTHSGPGNFFAADGYNIDAGRFPGFDPVVTDFLIDGIASAIEDAASDLQPAQAGWNFEPVWDFTFNRSYEAYERNTSPRVSVDSASPRPLDQQAVDSTFAVLRVDRCDLRWENCSPRGAYGVFAIHSSNIPASNNLFDSDIHGVIARTVEDHIRAARGLVGGSVAAGSPDDKEAYFLLAQGAHGDVGANLRDPVPCRLYRFLPEHRPSGPRTLPAPEAWRAPMSEVEACLNETRLEVDSFAAALGVRATEIFDRSATGLSSDLSIGRAFNTVDLRTYSGTHQLCWPPSMGAAGVGGAEKGYIRTWGQRLFFFDLNFDEGGSAARSTPEGCFGHKKAQLGVLIKEHTLPQVFQFGVYRLGDVLVGSVPVEPTTEVGALIRETVLRNAPDGVRRALAIGLANGYASYAASAQEYEVQHYEGGSTLYGPNTGQMLADELGQLAASLQSGNPTVGVDAALAFHSDGPTHFWAPRPIPTGFLREVVDMTCEGDEARVRWTDLSPGGLIPADAAIVLLERQSAGQWGLLADDADPAVQVRAVEEKGDVYLWEARWAPRSVPDGRYRFRLLARQGLPELVSPGCQASIR
jgi:neutral ceramidase